MTRYFIGVASRDHVRRGVAGGFAQLCHGKRSALAGLGAGDWIAYYSPRTQMDGGESVQAFTAIGRIVSGAPYPVDAGEGFRPHRVDVDFLQSAREAPIRPLLGDLGFTRLLGANWGGAFRQARLQVSEADFRRIAAAMGVESSL